MESSASDMTRRPSDRKNEKKKKKKKEKREQQMVNMGITRTGFRV